MHEEDSGPSKTELKRQMTALQKIGEELVGLSDRELGRVPIENDDLMQAIQEARRIRSNSARRRHLQYIGKLMRGIDAQAIERALAGLHQRRRGEANVFHEIERLRDQLIEQGTAGVEEVVERYPSADRQHLRQLLRQQEREAKQGKPPAAARKLFKYLRELALAP